MKKLIAALFAVMLTVSAAHAEKAYDPENTLFMDVKDGRVVIRLRPDLAPKHVERYKELTRQGFYDGLTFHRVLDGFMAQAGDPKGTGAGGTGVKLPAEFSREPFVRGTLGAARQPQDINSADSQFFIMFDTESSLNGDYTVFGHVIEGMEIVDKLNRCEPRQAIDPVKGPVMQPHCAIPGTQPDKIIKMIVAADEGKPAAPMMQDKTTWAPETK